MILNMVCAGAGILIGSLATAVTIYQLCFREEKDDDYYALDPIEIQTPSYEDCEEFDSVFEDMEAING